MTSVTYPDGTTLSGNALSPNDVVLILQPILCGMLGIVPPDYTRVRTEWPKAGQPAFGINEDIAFLRAVDENAEYSKQRDDQLIKQNGVTVARITYVVCWRVHFDFYGPNCYARAGYVVDALLLNWTSETLALAGLYVNPHIDRPIYLKEQRDAQWWPRASFSAIFSYQVTNTITPQTVTSAEILLYDSTGQHADILCAVPE